MIIYIYRNDIFYRENSEEAVIIKPLSYLKKINKRMVDGVIILEDQPASLFISKDKRIIDNKVKQLEMKFLVASCYDGKVKCSATVRKNKLNVYKNLSGKLPLLAVYPVNLLLNKIIDDGLIVNQLDEHLVRYDYYEGGALVHSQVAADDEQKQIDFYLKRNNIISTTKQKILAYASDGYVDSYESYLTKLLEAAEIASPDSSFIGFNNISNANGMKNRYLLMVTILIVLTVLSVFKYLSYRHLDQEVKVNKTIWTQIEQEYFRVKDVESDVLAFNSIISNNILMSGELFKKIYPFQGAVITRAFYHPERSVMEIQGYTAQNFDTFLNKLNRVFKNVQLISSYYQREVNLFKIMIFIGDNK